MSDPTVTLLSKAVVTDALSRRSEAVSICGLGEVAALARSTLPQQVAAALAPLLSEEALVQQRRAEWNARYAGFADRAFRVGEVVFGEDVQPRPDGGSIR